MPDTRDDFPDPETPVTAVMQPMGKDTSMFCRLLCWAPFTFSFFLPGLVRLLGHGMDLRPLR